MAKISLAAPNLRRRLDAGLRRQRLRLCAAGLRPALWLGAERQKPLPLGGRRAALPPAAAQPPGCGPRFRSPVGRWCGCNLGASPPDPHARHFLIGVASTITLCFHAEKGNGNGLRPSPFALRAKVQKLAQSLPFGQARPSAW